MISILLVEDDERVADALSGALKRMNYDVHRVATGKTALERVDVDLILLDLGLPDMDGMDVLTRIREKSTVPIVALTARGNNDSRVEGLRRGADDYVVKPFSLSELQARIEAVLRRTGLQSENVSSTIEVGQLLIDTMSHEVTLNAQSIALARKEYDLLVVLASEAGRVFSRADLLLKVWHTVWVGQSRTVDVHIGILRQKLGDNAYIRTVHGVGYALDTDRCNLGS